MGSKRSRDKYRRKCLFNFQTLISSLSSPKGLEPEAMEWLYLLLLNLDLSSSESNNNVSETEFNSNGFKVKFKEILEISDVLFTKLNAKFNDFFSASSDVSEHPVCAQFVFHVNVEAAIKELTLLLRCCIAVFKLLVLYQELLVEKGQLLLGLLRRCVSVELKGENEQNFRTSGKEVSQECMYVDDRGTIFLAEQLVTTISFRGHSNPFHAILCAMLEVFADELLMHESVRQYLWRAESLSSSNEFRFIRSGNIESVLEVICAHFILSISNDQAFKNFLNCLFWLPGNNFRVLEMTSTTAFSLLHNPIMLSAPKMFQAYLILLVSEIIGISLSSELMMTSSDLRLYLSVFERSVALYTRHISSLCKKGYPLADDDSFLKPHSRSSCNQMSFESCLLPATKEKINCLITKCDNFWKSYLCNTFLKERSDLVATSAAYTKECLHVFGESFGDEILSILSCIIHRASSDDVDGTELHKNEDANVQDICLIASILKLMSCSMLQALGILTQGRNSGSLKALENVALSKEYDFMVATFNCFQKFGVHLPVQKFLCDKMEMQPTMHKKSKWMLFHFSGLLSLSYGSGLDFLVKNCIFTLMILLNLLVFEAGDLQALGSLFGPGVTSTSSHKSSVKVGKSESHHKARKVPVDSKSSHAVALKFQKIQTLYLGRKGRAGFKQRAQDQDPGSSENFHAPNHVESALSVEENTGETCKSEFFLKCVGVSRNISDFADLADFIECKPGKDYSDWLKGRKKFSQWKHGKIAKFRWKKKRLTFQRRT